MGRINVLSALVSVAIALSSAGIHQGGPAEPRKYQSILVSAQQARSIGLITEHFQKINPTFDLSISAEEATGDVITVRRWLKPRTLARLAPFKINSDGTIAQIGGSSIKVEDYLKTLGKE